VAIGDTADDNDSMSGSCAHSDWVAGSKGPRHLSPDIASVMEVVERAACGSCLWVASDKRAAVACDDEYPDACNSSMHIRRDGECCCWLEALLRCRDRSLTPVKR
jgi:hypothetical protein